MTETTLRRLFRPRGLPVHSTEIHSRIREHLLQPPIRTYQVKSIHLNIESKDWIILSYCTVISSPAGEVDCHARDLPVRIHEYQWRSDSLILHVQDLHGAQEHYKLEVYRPSIAADISRRVTPKWKGFSDPVFVYDFVTAAQTMLVDIQAGGMWKGVDPGVLIDRLFSGLVSSE